ncbi:MAG TPA: carboxymuconolactone decarboxylase family protein [Caulobacteraceae bacterium]
MSTPLRSLIEALPPYASDIALNFGSVVAETLLTDQQKWGCLVASAHAVATPAVVKAVEAAAGEAGLSVEAMTAAKGAAAIMAQNNVYWRALDLLKNQEYRALRARLRMRIASNPGAPKDDFDLWCVAVSAIHGCPDCLDAHEGALRERGMDPTRIQTALRIAAVVHAATRVMAAEAAAAT